MVEHMNGGSFLTSDAAAGAAVIQINGNYNTAVIEAGGSKLEIRRLQRARSAPIHLTDLLQTDLRATALVGRNAQLDDLITWLAADPAISVRCVTGPAGAGKTRLAVEACAAADPAEEPGEWVAGFVTANELRRFHNTQNLANWHSPNHTLLVVDYAATSVLILKDWFAMLAPERHRCDRIKLRFLLLERQASFDIGWWADLVRRDSLTSAGSADLIGAELPLSLPRLSAVADRRALLSDAMRLAAPLLDPPGRVIAPPPPGTDTVFDEKIARDVADNQPLYLLMAGIHAARVGMPAALTLGQLELAEHMVSIETSRLRRFAESRHFLDNGELLLHLVSCITIQNGCALSHLTSLVEEEMAAMNMTAPMSAKAIATHLTDFLAINDTSIDPVRPNLIGEGLFLQQINGGVLRSTQTRQNIVLRAYHRSDFRTVAALVRAAQDWADRQDGQLAVDSLHVIVSAASGASTLSAITSQLPLESLALSHVAVKAQEQFVAALENQKTHDDSLISEVVGALNNLVNRYRDAGRRPEALAAASKANLISSTLNEATYEGQQLSALTSTTLSICLSDAGDHLSAMTAGEKAVKLYCGLTKAKPEVFTRYLASALSNLANRHSLLGQFNKAVAAIRHSTFLLRSLAFKEPMVYMQHYAQSLTNFSNQLGLSGQHIRALAPAKKSVRLLKRLAVEQPDAFLPRVITALNVLANQLGQTGDLEGCLAAATDSVVYRRILAKKLPERFEEGLAGALAGLADKYCFAGRKSEALALAIEAVERYRHLAQDRADAIMPDFCRSLSILADALEATGNVREAIVFDLEALTRYLPYAIKTPAAHSKKIGRYAADYTRRCTLIHKPIEIGLLTQINALPKS